MIIFFLDIILKIDKGQFIFIYLFKQCQFSELTNNNCVYGMHCPIMSGACVYCGMAK